MMDDTHNPPAPCLDAAAAAPRARTPLTASAVCARPRWPVLILVIALGLAAAAQARPTYFDVFTAHYGLMTGDDLYACGVCHYRWNGTGARTPYGSAIEQQLYIGKSILQSIIDVEPADSDGDGFSNGDEIATYGTLPGYSCANFYDAIEPPLGFQALITPLVPSCLEPLDIRVTPPSVNLITNVGSPVSATVTVFNNGADFPLHISQYGLLPGAPPSLSVVGPTAPFDIPVGESIGVQVVFDPTTSEFPSTALRIESDDPDEPTVDVPVSAFGFVISLAPAEKRAACLGEVQKTFRKTVKTALLEWGRCYGEEVAGRACDAGARDMALAKAEARLRAVLGGAKDRRCAAAALTPSVLGLPTTCGGGCAGLPVTTLTQFADCLVCRQREAVEAMLADVVGAVPPDPPTQTLSGAALGCQSRLIKAAYKGITEVQRRFGDCELANVTAPVPAVCATALADRVGKVESRIDRESARCSESTGVGACLFAPSPDPDCLKTRVLESGTGLVGAVFGL